MKIATKIMAEVIKSLTLWRRNKIIALMGFLPILLYTIFFIEAFSFRGDGGFELLTVIRGAPIAPGSATDIFIEALNSREGTIPYFDVRIADEKAVIKEFNRGKAAMILYIPPEFDKRITQGRAVELPVRINTIHEDLSKNLRLGIEARIYQFSLDQGLAREQRPGIKIKPIKTRKVLLRSRYMIMGTLVLSIMFISFFVGGVLASGEKDLGTLNEVMLAPHGRLATKTGKTIAAMIICLISLMVYLLLSYLFYGLWFPDIASVFHFLVVFTALSYVFSFLGVAYGWAVGDFRFIPAPTIIVTMTLWFLSGAINPLEFSAGSSIFKFLPSAGAIRILSSSFFKSGGELLGFSYLVLLAWVLLVLFINVFFGANEENTSKTGTTL
jgi:hypothetical protein